MRFVLAIGALVVAVLMIVLGLAQRTIFLEPASTSLTATVPSDAPFAVIDSSALTAGEGAQTLTLSGSDPVFMAYGRTADVLAWVDGSPYAEITATEDSTELAAELIEPEVKAAGTGSQSAEPVAPAPANPAGSDLWLEEFSDSSSLTKTINVPEGISVLVASDGAQPAPSQISVSWPRDNSTPWAGPLIAGGALLALIGVALYLWALIHLRRSQGPRRNLPKGPRMPKLPRAPRPKTIKASEITGPRRSISRSMAVVPVVLVGTLALSGCSPDFWPSAGPEPTKLTTATPIETPAPDDASADTVVAEVAPPAVTVPQLEQIVREIATTATDADATLNADAIATRFTGPALEQRLANYKIREKIPEYTAPAAIPTSKFELTLPQQTSSWPRVVMTVVKDKEDPTIAPVALTLVQENARSNYMVTYAVQLEAAAPVPLAAPAAIGAPIIKPDSKLLLMPPDQVAAAYADILANGEASQYYSMFEVEGDSFRTQVGVDAKNAKKAALPTTASIEFGAAPGSGPALALATNDAGGLVAVNLNETETVRPVEAGATVSPEGASAALSGVTATAKGIQSTYGDQLLFHIPAAGSNEKIVLLGFAQGLIASAELP